jgi:hypothetical protein
MGHAATAFVGQLPIELFASTCQFPAPLGRGLIAFEPQELHAFGFDHGGQRLAIRTLHRTRQPLGEADGLRSQFAQLPVENRRIEVYRPDFLGIEISEGD